MYIKKLKELTTIRITLSHIKSCCLANVHKKIKRTHNMPREEVVRRGVVV